ncbi:MAG: CorA family divalent cation transporter [Pirellulales bacterium]
MHKTVLPVGWKVPELFVARLGETAGRQRAMASEGHLLIVLHEPPGPDDVERRGRLFWRGPDGSWKSNTLGAGVQALRKHVADFAELVDNLEDAFQQSRGAEDYFAVLQAIAPLHRTARNMHAALQQARELMPDERDLIVLRDQASEVELAAELLHGDAKNGLDFTMARQSEEQTRRGYEMARSAHRLNLLAAIFFPVATLSAIFGMNLVHGFESFPSPLTFWVVLAVGLLGGMLLTASISQRPKPHQPAIQHRQASPHKDPFLRAAPMEAHGADHHSVPGAAPPSGPAAAASRPASRQ